MLNTPFLCTSGKDGYCVTSSCSGACLFIMLMGTPPYKPEDAGMAKLHANMMMGRMSRMKENLSLSEFSACELT